MSVIDEIKQRLDLTDVIRSYIKVEKAGSNFKACCPFHNEKTPSFYISPSRNVWHCFGCAKGGSVFDFVMEIEKIDFSEALAILAKRAGVELVKENPAVLNERTRLLKILESAKKFYVKNLEGNEKVMDYLIKERGLVLNMIKEFELGYAPDGWRNLYDYLRQENYSDSEIEKAGLIINKLQSRVLGTNYKQNSYYDRFRSRIIFPINDQSGRTIAFGGRIFETRTDTDVPLGSARSNLDLAEPSKPQFESGLQVASYPPTGQAKLQAKYINSPQTALYDKSRVLFNFNKAKFEISKADFCVLVEGYMDAIMSYQAGIKNVVAVSGTALTQEHLNLIGRLTKSVVISFDSDEAGNAATNRGIDLLLEKGFEIKVLNIKEEKDPADLIKKSEKLWEEAVTQKKSDIVNFYLDFLKNKYGKDEIKFATEAKNIIFPRLVFINSEIERSLWIKKMANNIGVNEDAVRFEFQKFQNKKNDLKSKSGGAIENESILSQNKQTRLGRLEERITGILAIAFFKPIKEKLSGAVLKNLDDFSFESQLVLKNILANGDVKIGEENTMLQTLALKTEVFYNLNDNELELEFANLLNDLKKERVRDKLGVLGVEIKKLGASRGGAVYEKIEEFNKLSKELKNLL